MSANRRTGKSGDREIGGQHTVFWLTSGATAGWVCSWRPYPRQSEEAGLAESMRRRENTGRPLGDQPLLERLSGQRVRNAVPAKGGRPR